MRVAVDPAYRRESTREWARPQIAHRPWPVLSVLCLIGFYISLDTRLGQGVIPNILATPFGLMLLAVHWRRISIRPALLAGAITIFYALSGLYAGVLFGNGSEQLLPPLQFAYTVLPAYGLFLDLTLWKKKDFHEFTGLFTAFIVVGSVLEVYTPFREIPLAIARVHQASMDYTGRDWGTSFRDIQIYGQYRPKLFCSETSYVGINFGIFMTMWALTRQGKPFATAAIIAVTTLVALFVIRSPFCILPAIILTSFYALNAIGGQRAVTGLGLLFGSFVVIGVTLAFGSLMWWTFGNRIGMAQTGADWSVITRTYGAIIAGYRVALVYPFFGAGVGNFEDFRAIQAETFIDFRVPAYVIQSDFFSRLMNNGWGSALAFFGFLGTFVHTFLWLRLMRSLSPLINTIAGLALLTIVYFTSGAIYVPKVVWPIFIISAAIAITSRPRAERYNMRGGSGAIDRDRFATAPNRGKRQLRKQHGSGVVNK